MEFNKDFHKYKFFQHKECEFFPCHETHSPETFNCVFCYCPLYEDENCGGNCTYTSSGIKDCSGCLIPHVKRDQVVEKILKKRQNKG